MPGSARQKTNTRRKRLVAVIERLDLLKRFQRLRGPGISRLTIKFVESIASGGIVRILSRGGLHLPDRFGKLPYPLVRLRQNYVVGIFIGLQADCFFREVQREIGRASC